MAIAKFVARKAGMAGETELEFARADMVACHSEDLWKYWPKLRFQKDQVGQVSHWYRSAYWMKGGCPFI